MKIGDLVTPTGRLVLPPERLGGDEWLEKRRWRDEVPGGYCIGSSEVPSILDLEGVDTPAHIYRRKVSNIDTPVNEAMWLGSEMEGAIALAWARRNRAVIDEIGLVSNVDRPWRQATIDRRVRECPVYRDTKKECLLEIKLVGYSSAAKWKRDIPDRVLAQIIDQLMVTGYGHAHYAALVSSTHLAQGIIYADREQKLMAYIDAEVERFRTEHLLTGREPEWNVSEKPDKMIALDEATHPERVGTLDIEGIGEVMEYARLARRKADAETARKAAAARLRQLADGREFVTFAGQLAYRLGPTRNTNVDLDKLKEKYPDAYADPEVVSETTSHTIYIDKAYKVGKGDE